MGEFFKQLIAQVSAIWEKLSLQQRIIISALVGFMFFGLFGLVLWSGSSSESGGGSSSGMKRLYSGIAIEEMAEITEQLEKGSFKYDLRHDGTSIYVPSENLYEVRMSLAREGLPVSRGTGFELFDKVSLGATDFEQKVKMKRAIQGELTRTIESIREIESVRIHVVMSEESIFLEEQKPAKASVKLKVRSGRKLTKDQVRGISYLVSNSIESMDASDVTIIDNTGRLLSNPYSDDPAALASSRNIELQTNVEMQLQRKVERLLSGVFGQGKTSITIAADLDFDQVESTLEKFNPEGKVVRSEERDETSVKNAPDGDRTNERSLSNYEIDKTVERIIREVGNVKRLTVAVIVNGTYNTDEEGKRTYASRTPEELTSLESIIKNAVGYDLTRGDKISVQSMKFDESRDIALAMENEVMSKGANTSKYINYVVLLIILIIAIIIIVQLSKSMVEAMNPPMPEVEIPNIVEEEEQIVEIPKNIARSNELLERVEIMTENDPNNVAKIIKDWLNETTTKKD